MGGRFRLAEGLRGLQGLFGGDEFVLQRVAGLYCPGVHDQEGDDGGYDNGQGDGQDKGDDGNGHKFWAMDWAQT